MNEVLPAKSEIEPAQHTQSVLAAHLEEVCSSPAFAGSGTLRNLLRYLYSHRDQQVSEYTIAIEALGRRSDFDPQVDATVRVQISRLRRRLKEHYQAEGTPNVRFTIPLGTHQLRIESAEPLGVPQDATASASASSVSPPAHPSPRRQLTGHLTPLLVALVVVLGIICISEAWLLRTRTSQKSEQLPLLPFWKEFLGNGSSTHILLPNPTFFTWGFQEGSGLLARDTAVNDYSDAHSSPGLSWLMQRYGKPQLAQFYAVSSDVLAATTLMRYLDARGANADIMISSNASAEAFETGDVILTGTPGTLMPFRRYLDRLYFRFDPEGGHLLNPSPRGSEPRQFNVIEESPSHIVLPGLIAYIPGPSRDGHILIVASRQTSALMDYLTSSEGSKELAAARRNAGGGPYFEAVIVSEMTGYTVLRNHLVAFRAETGTPAQN